MKFSAAFRVVHVFPDCARRSSGPTNAILGFMESQLLHGMDVQGISPSDPCIPEGERQEIERWPIREFRLDEIQSAAIEYTSKNRPTIFHFDGTTAWSNKLARSLHEMGIPYVFTSHGHLLCHGRIQWIKKFLYLNALSPFLRKAGGLHFCTQQEADWSRYLLPKRNGEHLVLHNLLRVPDPSTVSPWPREQLGIPEDAFVFAFLGRMHVEHKGLDLLMKAFSFLPDNTKAFLMMAGPDFSGGRQQLKQMARDLGCEKRVLFLVSQIGNSKWKILKAANAFVSPSRWESFGIAAAEAMGMGLPTIVSKAACVAPELVRRGAALASPLSAPKLAQLMRKLIEDEPLRKSLAQAGRSWVLETCSLEFAGPRFAEFYSRVLSQARPRSPSRKR